MGKRKFEQELDSQLGRLARVKSRSRLCRKRAQENKLPLPPKIGEEPIIHMKLSWGEVPEVYIKVMLDLGANVAVISKKLVEKHRAPAVIRERAEITSGYDGAESIGAGSAYTFACTLRLGDHYAKETFKVSSLQEHHDVILPWW